MDVSSKVEARCLSCQRNLTTCTSPNTVQMTFLPNMYVVDNVVEAHATLPSRLMER